ncbi:MAG: UDP-N-acetylglucosamine 2-epimerase [Pseudomonadota bacterium]
MSASQKIAVVTGSRADFGLLRSVIAELKTYDKFEVQVWATGMHLSEHFGNTYQDIEKVGFSIDEKVPCLSSEDTDEANTLAVSRAMKGWAEVFKRNRPDLLMVLGDRFEILAAVQSALFFQIPVAHLCGGDVTEGAFDEAIRHSITKSAHIHFVTNEDSKQRVLQMGENPEHVYNFGSPAIDLMKQIDLMSKKELTENLGVEFSEKNFLITFHPQTITDGDVKAEVSRQMDALIEALKTFKGQASFFITGTNADKAYSIIDQKMAAFCDSTDRAYGYQSLGAKRYWSLMGLCDVVIGNSSSGLYEAPSFKVPTVNIGDRQKGRLAAQSVIQVPSADKALIVEAIEQSLKTDCQDVKNPYGEGGASRAIGQTLEKYQSFSSLVQKHFFAYPQGQIEKRDL